MTSPSTGEIAISLKTARKYEEAIPYFKEALRLREMHLPQNKRAIETLRENLRDTYRKAGLDEEAEVAEPER